jgi:NADH-quinone oxidoreductase subunit J
MSMDINWPSIFFLLAALLTCGFALAVVISSNIVRMAFYLVMSLGGVAALFFLAGADFLGGRQLLVDVGGTVVLLAFGVMLTARGPLVRMKTPPGQWVLAALVGGSLLVVLLQVALSVGRWAGEDRPEARGLKPVPPTAEEEEWERRRLATAAPLGLGLLGVRVDQQEEKDLTLRAGMSGYLLGFELISVHLVVVLIGAAYLARAKRRAGEPGDGSPGTGA